MTQPSIEQLILAHGTRGMERIARYLPPDYAARAARALWKSPHVLITTGFYIAGRYETDGPPGAFFLGRTLARLGSNVSFVAEQAVLDLLGALGAELWSVGVNSPNFIEFPIIDAEASRALAQEIILNQQPSAIVAVERCGRTTSNHYRNMHGDDISPFTARVDDLFVLRDGGADIVTVAVGDGGNEIGMGTLGQYIPGELGITDTVETRVDHLVLAAVSNWGAYGITACLSNLAGTAGTAALVPTSAEEAKAVGIIVDRGAIDARSRRAEPNVDGFSPEATAVLLDALRSAC